jgi:hypothetical protein
MWQCTTCGETLEEQFDACWNCGTRRNSDGSGLLAPDDTSVAQTDRNQHGSTGIGRFVLDAAQRKEFRAVAYWMGIVGRIELLCSAVMLAPMFFFHKPGAVISAALLFVIGLSTVFAATTFRRAAEADSQDAEGPIAAISGLKDMYRLHALLIASIAALIIVLITAAMAHSLW